MKTDSYYCIGKTHKVCQDYCINGEIPAAKYNKDDPAIPFIIVSDGCSSSENTDIGARLLVKSAQSNIPLWDGNTDAYRIYIIEDEARIIGNKIGNLGENFTDATLLIAFRDKDDIKVIVSGDGVICAIDKNNTAEIKTIVYKDNAPLYPSYFGNEERKKQLLATYDCSKTITTYDDVGKVLKTEISNNDFEVYKFPIDKYQSITLFSDGVESFTKTVETATSKHQASIDVAEVVSNLTAFKGFAGNFVLRRAIKYLKDCEKIGTTHADDLSIATIYLGE